MEQRPIYLSDLDPGDRFRFYGPLSAVGDTELCLRVSNHRRHDICPYVVLRIGVYWEVPLRGAETIRVTPLVDPS